MPLPKTVSQAHSLSAAFVACLHKLSFHQEWPIPQESHAGFHYHNNKPFHMTKFGSLKGCVLTHVDTLDHCAVMKLWKKCRYDWWCTFCHTCCPVAALCPQRSCDIIEHWVVLLAWSVISMTVTTYFTSLRFLLIIVGNCNELSSVYNEYVRWESNTDTY